MLLQLFASLDVPRPGTWLPPALGLLTSGLLVYGAHLLLGRRSFTAGSADTDLVNGLPRDPFRACFAERRGSPRQAGKAVGVLVAGTDTARTTTARVLDRSMDGLALAVSHRAVPGTLLAVRRRDALPTAPWAQLRVRYCRPGETGWKVGGPFIGGPSLSALLFA